jgi:mannobiose 2-epimerase
MKEPSRKFESAAEFEQELTGNILPFWMTHAPDEVNGGFYGALTNDLQIHNEVPRSAILCARILWTFSSAYRHFGADEYLAFARRAFDYLTGAFWDAEYGGLYWHIDRHGIPISDRKHHYAQAYAIYALCEFYMAANDPRSLVVARELFHLLEAHAYEPIHGGYIEGSSRAWETLDDMRLSNREPNCRKSMNTMLHMLEAYTNLLRVWDSDQVRDRHRRLVEGFLDHIIDPYSLHFGLFFSDAWDSLSPNVSYGHDIEGSWLLWEAAGVQDDAGLSARARQSAIGLAEVVYREGLDGDGSLFSERGPNGLVDASKSWWEQAEAVVGFYNAYQLTGKPYFAEAAARSWHYAKARLVDRRHGDWFKRLHPDGTPDASVFKVGPWECPYHHSRACLEMMSRLGHGLRQEDGRL